MSARHERYPTIRGTPRARAGHGPSSSWPDASKPNAWYRETRAMLLVWLAAGKFEPIVAERFPLGEAVRAHEMLEGGGYAGKAVLVAGA